MRRLKILRKKIDQIDNNILELLNERAQLTKEVGRIKSKNAKPIFSPERESQVYSRLIRHNKGPLSEDTIKAIYREIMSGSLALERALKIAYLGPEATFTHIAALSKFGQSLGYIECKSIADVFTEVERDVADYGVVPIENSTEGAVNHTLDMLVDSDLKICSEVYLPIHLYLLSRGKKLSSIKRVFSHEQVFAQCRIWLEKNLPNAKQISCTSTTQAALFATMGKTRSAIASELAAEKYGLNILARYIEDSRHNITRFLVIGKHVAQKTDCDKTSIVFSMKDKAGALHDVLTPFKRNNINLTMIESRPSKTTAWKYYFYVDMEGHVNEKGVSVSLKQLQRLCNFYKFLGSYPIAEE